MTNNQNQKDFETEKNAYWRKKSNPGETPQFVTDNPISLDPNKQLQTLVDRIGDFMKHCGFRKVDGMIWAYLFLAPRPLASKEITKLMNISKGLTSISVHNLIDYGFIKEVHRGRKGTVYYTSTEALGEVIEDILRHREREMIGDIDQKIDSAKNHSQENHDWKNKKRFEQLQYIIDNAKELLDSKVFEQKVLDHLNFDAEKKPSSRDQ
jgi:DNA-binding transcriptional regulator GbsR (MarR family)